MEYEGFIYNPASEKWIEVADYGMYSPIALARYDLDHPVLNVGIGVERLAMVLHRTEDIRTLVYPQFYAEFALSDSDIAQTIQIRVEPNTEVGREIRKGIVSEALKNADAPSPCEFLAYQGNLLNKTVIVYIYEKDRNARLLGAAARNSIFVHDGNVIGVPAEKKEHVNVFETARERGIPTGIRFVDSIASLAASRIEEAVEAGKEGTDLRVRLARRPSDINIEIGDVARRYIMSQKKKIEITGPVFVGIRAEIID